MSHMARLVVWCNGDPSVGISGDQATIEVCAASEAHKREIESDQDFREALVKVFSTLWDWAPRHVHVLAVDECDVDDDDDEIEEHA